MKKIIFLFLIAYCSMHTIFGQVEKVIVETYYVSDANDAKDTIAGKLEAGSKTYRIFIDLKEGTILRKIYGDINHPLKFKSTADFFNNTDRGTSFGKDINDKKINENTLALDTWLTLGLATKKHKGVLKGEDKDGSVLISQNPQYGMFLNADPAAGIPLTIADGLALADSLPTSWTSYGLTDISSGVDSTIFGSVKKGSQFMSNNVGLQCSGIKGITKENKVLVAQLTTKGDLSFELNIEVEEKEGSSVKTVRYVASGDNLSSDERLCPYLKYPPVCGCADPKYLEYKPDYSCNNPESCRTPIVFGCMDPMACNYDPKANFNLPDMCCYPGRCNDRDISLVCPNLGKYELIMKLSPNPAKELLDIQVASDNNQETKYLVYDFLGRFMLEKNEVLNTGNSVSQVNVSGLSKGLYFLKMICKDGNSVTKMFIKN